jgi:hypothetical protein
MQVDIDYIMLTATAINSKWDLDEWLERLHCEKRFAIFPSTAGMSLTKLSLGGNNLIIPI